MKTHKKEIHQSGRLIMGSIMLAGALIFARLVYNNGIENEAIRLFATTAVYMLGPLLASMIILPVTQHPRWLYITASLVSLTIVLPWAFINPTMWAQKGMVQLGSNANTLFFMLMVMALMVEPKSTKTLWSVTAVYLLILFILPIL